MRFKVIGIFLSALFFCAISCGFSRSIKGDGNVVDKRTDLSEFSKLRAEGSLDVVLNYTSGTPYVLITTDNNIQEYIKVIAKDGELIIKSEGNIKPTKLKAYVYTSHYNMIELHGSGNLMAASPLKEDELSLSVRGSGDADLDIQASRATVNVYGSGDANLKIKADKLTMSLRGSGDLDVFSTSTKLSLDLVGSGDANLFGTSNTSHINLKGSGSVHAKKLVVESCEAKIHGSGDIKIHATDALYSTIHGSGSVYCVGSPSKVKSKVHGSGSVHFPNGVSNELIERS